MPSGPANSRVCAMRSCSIIRSRAAVTWSLPRKLSNMRAHHAPNLLRHLVHARPPVDRSKSLRLGRRQRAVSVADSVVELRFLLLHAVGAIPTPIARLGASLAGSQIDLDEQREVRLETAAGNPVESQHGIGAQSAAASLVRQGRVGEPVREYDLAFVQRGQN